MQTTYHPQARHGFELGWLVSLTLLVSPGPGRTADPAAVAPHELVVLVDTSGSMGQRNKLEGLKLEMIRLIESGVPVDGTWRLRIHPFDRGLSQQSFTRVLRTSEDQLAAERFVYGLKPSGSQTQLYAALDAVLNLLAANPPSVGSPDIVIHLFTDGLNTGGGGSFRQNLQRFAQLRSAPSTGDADLYFHALNFEPPAEIVNLLNPAQGTHLVRDLQFPPRVRIRPLAFQPLTTTPVSFVLTKLGAIEKCLWNFGDGQSSTDEAPTHRFSRAGTFSVTCTASNPAGSKTATLQVTVLADVPVPVADFEFAELEPRPNSTAGTTVGAAVQFRNLSQGSTSVAWDFGDGQTSTESDPIHGYAAPGTYNVSLQAINPAGTHRVRKSVTITPLPVARFSFKPAQPRYGEEVQFLNESTGYTECVWQFGDGRTSLASQPGHTYARPGTCQVTLRVKDLRGRESTATATITVQGDPPPVARLSSSVLSVFAGQAFLLRDESVGQIQERVLDLGDGRQLKTNAPITLVHTCPQAGKFQPTLTVRGPGGTNACTLTIPVEPVTARISCWPVPIYRDEPVRLTLESSAAVRALVWELPGGHRVTTNDLVYTFRREGAATIRVSYQLEPAPGARASQDGARLTAEATLEVKPPERPVIAYALVAGKRRINAGGVFSGTAPLTVQLTNLSTGPIKSNRWDHGDGQFSRLAHPTHTYTEPGTYTNSLTLWSQRDEVSSPSLREHFLVIHVDPPPPPWWLRWVTFVGVCGLGYGTVRRLHRRLACRRVVIEDDRGERRAVDLGGRDPVFRTQAGQLLAPGEGDPSSEFRLRLRQDLRLRTHYVLDTLRGTVQALDPNSGTALGPERLGSRFHLRCDEGLGTLIVQTHVDRRPFPPGLRWVTLIGLLYLVLTWPLFR